MDVTDKVIMNRLQSHISLCLLNVGIMLASSSVSSVKMDVPSEPDASFPSKLL
jgi:hypothetical protein